MGHIAVLLPTVTRHFCTISGAIFLVATLVTAQADPVADNITRVSITERSDKSGYVVRLHSTEYIKAFSSPKEISEGRFEIVLFNSSVSPSVQKDEVRGPLKSYFFEEKDGHPTFRFSLLDGLPIDVSAYRDRDSNDLLIGLSYSSETVAEVEVKPVVNTGPTAEARSRWLLDTIVIDAGHGGVDPGTNWNGVKEKDVTLAVALKVGAYLEEYLGVNVVYTRKTDVSVDLKKRGPIANEAGGKLFVSIHADAQPRSSSVHGATMYVLGTHKSEAARRVMERENSVVRFEDDQEAYEEYDNQALIKRVLTQSAYIKQSEQLASMLEEQFAKRANRKTRGVKQAPFWVLWSASMPAVLIELGYITNRKEARYLESDLGQTYLASAIYRAIRDFKFAYEKELALTTSQ